ncbi:MAG: NUDIX domain-containing protein [Clostridia bacterium]|nr:NUDIX domain-containing protein [Clostridia bacterium]
MNEVKIYTYDEIPDEKLKYAVVASRYNGKWIFCRHKDRTTWEIPGGHREPSEAIEETAKRELYEETGASDFDLEAVCIYGVDSYGALFFAEVKELSDIPKSSEIAEIGFFEKLPEVLTYPAIQPRLFHAVNGWLCNRTSTGELWDIYDGNKNRLEITHRRGEPLQKGHYHLTVHIWIKNSRGEFLITKRAPHKGFPNMWECTGGSALSGDDSLTAALREVKEETNLTLAPENGSIIHSYRGHDYFCDIWLFSEDHDLSEVVLCPEETTDKMLADGDTIRKMIADGTFIDYSYIDRVLD